MIGEIKDRLWDFLQGKQVSLAMLFDASGRILWSRGRSIRGRQVREGEGFSRTHILRVLEDARLLKDQNIVISSREGDLPRSARILDIKSLLIQPLGQELFLYADSGNREYFTEGDTAVIRMLGDLLSSTLRRIDENENQVEGICGESEAIRQLKKRVLKYSLEEDPIFILGENGAGKTHIARLIHRYSGRPGEFVVVNTPSIPDNLLETEIFGCRKGGHSEAKEDKPGLVERAEKGTVFFDEIAEISVGLQAKLLQFIETGTFRRVGDIRDRRVAARILAATNRDLKEEIKNRRFREDLFYRLNILPLRIPPLRERPEDIPGLVEIFADHLKGKELNDEARDRLLRHSWPGNVRELRAVLKRAGLCLDGEVIGGEIAGIIDTMGEPLAPGETETWEEIREGIRRGESFFDRAWRLFLSRDLNRREMTAFLKEVYRENDRSLKKTARALNIKDRYRLFVKYLHQYDIHPDS